MRSTVQLLYGAYCVAVLAGFAAAWGAKARQRRDDHCRSERCCSDAPRREATVTEDPHGSSIRLPWREANETQRRRAGLS